MNTEKAEIKKFFIKFSIFAAPFAAFTLLYFIADPFQVLHPRDNYYVDCHVEPNRDFVVTEIFLKRHKLHSYDSFIFGNSRSRAFECREWAHYEKDASCFHFSANADNIYGISEKVRLIDQSGSKLRSVLLILDWKTLAFTTDIRGHLYVKHPALSGRSWFSFQTVFFQAFFEDMFFVKFADYFLFHSLRPYMKGVIHEKALKFDPVTNDDIYEIEGTGPQNTDPYSAEAKNLFYERKAGGSAPLKPVIGPEARQMLEGIRQVFERHHTRYQIIISPLYDQIPFNPQDLAILRDMFGADHVFDFSGVNEFTSDYHNHWEPNHYKPAVAKEILRRIYQV